MLITLKKVTLACDVYTVERMLAAFFSLSLNMQAIKQNIVASIWCYNLIIPYIHYQGSFWLRKSMGDFPLVMKAMGDLEIHWGIFVKL